MKLKEEKKSYNLLQNIWYILKHMWKWDKRDVFWAACVVPTAVVISLLETYMTKTVVGLVTVQASVSRLIVYILLFTLGILLFYYLKNIATTKSGVGFLVAEDRFVTMYYERYMKIDYENLVNPMFQLKAEKALRGISSKRTSYMMEKSCDLFASIIGMVTYAVILFPLSPWIIVIMVFVSTIGYFIYGYNHKWERVHRDARWSPIWKHMRYHMEKNRGVQEAKDIRIFGMSPLLEKRMDETLDEFGHTDFYGQCRWKIIDTIFAGLTMVRDFIAYGMLIYKVYTDGMSTAEFVFYFNALTMFIQWLLQFYEGVDMARFSSYELCDYRDFMEEERYCTKGGQKIAPKETCEIEFQNVGYTYPESDTPAFANANLKIKKGEKIAIVGPNGAGKTTMVKLLCGLYSPTQGKILIDGHEIQEYDKESYYDMFSAVFQDIAILPKSILENITFCPENNVNEKQCQLALSFSGLSKKLDKFPKGRNTLLVKELEKEAIALSGGEMQKLALARALYKNGKVLILDEPTAALDPIAESEIYEKYNELAKGKTAIFISHRLASTKFCDRIFYIEKGRITEVGTHDELLNLGGQYAEMFRIQSQYYTEQGDPETKEEKYHEECVMS